MPGPNFGVLYSPNVPEIFDWNLLDGIEPCDDCDRGLIHILNFEGRRLCQNCMDADIEARGFDVLPASWDREVVPGVTPETTTEVVPLVKETRKYIKRAEREKLEREKRGDGLF